MSVSVESASAPVAKTSLFDVAFPGVSGPGKVSNITPALTTLVAELTFEQKKKTASPAQLQQEQKNAELAHVQTKQHLGHYELELIIKGKHQPEPLKAEGSALLVCPTPSFDVAVNLELVPKGAPTSSLCLSI